MIGEINRSEYFEDEKFADIRYHLSKGADLSDVKINGLSPLEFATYNSNYNLVKAILENGSDNSNIQELFELAADSGQPDIARLFVEAGADYNSGYNYDNCEGQRCPICYHKFNFSEMDDELCQHWVTTSCEGYDAVFEVFTTHEDFNNEVCSLASIIKRIPPPDFKNLLATATDELREIFIKARQRSYYYWDDDPEIIQIEWRVYNFQGDCGYNYFHPDTSFGSRVKAEAKKALAWLEQQYPQLFEHENFYDFNEYDASDDREYESGNSDIDNLSGEKLTERLYAETNLTPRELASKMYQHISNQIGEATPAEYMRRIEEMKAKGIFPDPDKFMELTMRAFLKAKQEVDDEQEES